MMNMVFFTIDVNRVSSGGISQTESGTQVTEASTIGLSPGKWPLKISLSGEIYERWREMDHNGEFSGIDYRHPTTGAILRIYND
jgi:hypothetical protein